MPAKRKPTSTETKPSRGERLAKLYPSLAHGPSPTERGAELEARMRQRGVRPIEDFDRYLEEVGDFWPADETCDEFLTWLHALRREGRP